MIGVGCGDAIRASYRIRLRYATEQAGRKPTEHPEQRTGPDRAVMRCDTASHLGLPSSRRRAGQLLPRGLCESTNYSPSCVTGRSESEAVPVPGWSARTRAVLAAALELTGPHDRDVVLQRIVEGAASVADARYAALGVYDMTGAISTFVHHGADAVTVAAIGRLPEGRGLLGEVIIADRPIRIIELAVDPRSCGFPPGHPPMRTFLGVPVVRAGRRYGNLYLTEKRSGRPFDDTDEALVVAFAAFAAGAIESTELVESERARIAAEEQVRARRALFGEVIAAQEAERARVSRDLHDDVGQALTSVLLGLHLVEDSLAAPSVDLPDARSRVADLRELVADALRRARQLAFDLRPTVLDDIGLVPALQRLTVDVAERSNLDVELAVTAFAPDERLSPEAETVVYRIVQEALTNVVRHAHASHASVTITARDAHIRALVEDDGTGFNPDQRQPEAHLGLDGMAERAALIGATLQVLSEPGSGTVVMLEVARG
jgi:signal transduction histidine kinase